MVRDHKVVGSNPVASTKTEDKGAFCALICISRASVIYVFVNSLVLAFVRAQSATLLLGFGVAFLSTKSKATQKQKLLRGFFNTVNYTIKCNR